METLEYVATKDLPVHDDGETRLVHAGDPIPHPERWGRSLHANIEAGNIIVRTSLQAFTTQELEAELKQRVRPATPRRPRKAA